MNKVLLRSLSLIITLVILLLSVASCETESGETVKLYVYNWGEYISDGSEGSYNTNQEFEKWYYENFGQKVEVIYSTYSSNEDMYAKLSSGSINYDVIVPSDYMIERLIEEDQLYPLDYSNIPNINNIAPEFYGDEATYDYYDKGNVYSVPYFYGMIGIIYNTSMVDENDEDIGSWSLMWDEDYKGNILQFNNSRDAFGTAQYYLGIDVNTNDETEWRKALELLRAQKGVLQGYVMDEIFNKMEGGSAAIAAYYAGDYLAMYESNEDLEFFYPKEGTNLYVDAMCIPKCAQNKTVAERYISFMLTEDPAIANAEYTYYASPNKKVIESTEYQEYMSEIKEDAYEKMYPENVKATYYKNLDEKKLVLLNSLWEELKSDMEIGVGIYISCGAIIVSLIVMLFVFLIKKRSRRKMYDAQ